MSNQRLAYIDMAKGIAIVLVVLGHILQYGFSGEPAFRCFSGIYSFHMPLFMFLSGYTVTRSRLDSWQNYKQFLVKRAYTLLIPFFSWGLIVDSLIINHDLSWSSVINLIQHPDTGLWFLLSLFCLHLVYLVVVFISRIIPYGPEWLRDTVAVVGIIVLMEVIYKTMGIQVLYYSRALFVLYFIGMLCSKYFPDFMMKKWILVPMALAGLYLCSLYDYHAGNITLKTIISICMSFSVMGICRGLEEMADNERMRHTLVLLGKSSLVIYIIHLYLLIKLFAYPMIDSSQLNAVSLFFWLILPAVFISLMCIYLGRIIASYKPFAFLFFGKK